MNKKSKVLNAVKSAAEKSLTADANSTTCGLIYQPKAPAALKKFSKVDDK